MADQKVSDLPSLNGADVDPADLLYIIDSSAGSAGSKKITVGQYQLAPVSGGTADTVVYLNGSKVESSSAALTFDGSNLGIGTSSPAQRLDVAGAQNSVQARFGNVAGRGLEIGTALVAGTNDAGSVLNAKGATSGTLIFQTDSTERARITSGGDLLVGTTSASGKFVSSTSANTTYSGWFESSAASGVLRGVQVKYSGQSPNDAGNIMFLCADSTASRLYVNSNGGIGNYQANDVNLSDRREKTNFAPAKSYLDTICAIPVQTFNYIDQSKDDPGLTLGVVAQDVQAVAPELVMESNWGTEDNPKMRLSIYQTDLQYALMKAIQELKAQNDELRARVAALESA